MVVSNRISQFFKKSQLNPNTFKIVSILMLIYSGFTSDKGLHLVFLIEKNISLYLCKD